VPDIYVHASACKRGVSEEGIRKLCKSGIEGTWLDDRDPSRLLRISFYASGRAWELIALVFDDGRRYLVIHAMRLRKVTIALLEGRSHE